MNKKYLWMSALVLAGLATTQEVLAAEATNHQEKETVEYAGRKVTVTVDRDAPKEAKITQRTQHDMGSTFKKSRANGTDYVTDKDKGRPRWDFIDVSSHNGPISVSDYEKMKAAGVKGVCVKLTEATNYRNPYAKTQVVNAQKAGLQVSTYHFSHFASKAQAEAEADYYAAYAKELGLPKSTVMVNDFECAAHGEFHNAASNSVYFAKRLILHYGYEAVLHYASASVFNQYLTPSIIGETSMWVAGYPYTPSADHLQYTNRAAWQWTDNMHFNGVVNNETGGGNTFDASIDYTGFFTRDFEKEEKPEFHIYNRYGTVMRDDQTVYSDFAPYKKRGSTAALYHNTYRIKGYYDYRGERYYTLYDKNNKWQGYVNKKFIKENDKSQGGAISLSGQYGTVYKESYNAWRTLNPFEEKQPSSSIFQKTYVLSCQYHTFEGATYYSLYDEKNNWQGYVNKDAVAATTKRSGKWLDYDKYGTIMVNHYKIWKELQQFKSYNGTSEPYYQKTVRIDGKYNHVNGNTYYSLYDNQDRWIGYIDAQGVKTSDSRRGQYFKDEKSVQIVKENYSLYDNLDNFHKTGKTGADYRNVTLTARGYYHHENGETYYTLYDDNGDWQGYINANACRIVNQ